MRSWILGAALGATTGLIACAGDKDGPGADGEPMLTGTITIDGEDLSGDVEVVSAFGFDSGDKFIAYLSSDPATTCEIVAEYITSSKTPYDPADVFEDGLCNMFIGMSSGYEEGLESEDDPVLSAGTALECPLGDGEFVLETRDGDDRDYYWSDRWWIGNPEAYTYAFSGGSGDDYVLDIEMTAYRGGFPYEEWDQSPASGKVTGSVAVEYCERLGTTGWF